MEYEEEETKRGEITLKEFLVSFKRKGVNLVRQPEKTQVFAVKRRISKISGAEEKPPVIKYYYCGELGHVKDKCLHKKERCS